MRAGCQEACPRKVPIRGRCSHRLQGPKHVLADVVGVFKPNRDPHQAVADAELGTLRRRKPLMRCCCRMRDQALGVAEIVADANELERVLKAKRAAFAALDLKGYERR